MNLYGIEVDMPDIDPGETVTDVIVIVRTMSFDERGRPSDDLYIGGTDTTTGIVHTGMMHAAMEGLHAGIYDDEDRP